MIYWQAYCTMGLFFHVLLQFIILGISVWDLSFARATDLSHIVSLLIIGYIISNVFALIGYRRFQGGGGDIEDGCLGCVPSIGNLHRTRLRFFVFCGSLSMMLFILLRDCRSCAIIFSVGLLLSTLMTLKHCVSYYTKTTQLLISLPICTLLLCESISNKSNVIIRLTGGFVGWI